MARNSTFDIAYGAAPDAVCEAGLDVLMKRVTVECLCAMVHNGSDAYALTLTEEGGLNLLFDAARCGHREARRAAANALASLRRILEEA